MTFLDQIIQRLIIDLASNTAKHQGQLRSKETIREKRKSRIILHKNKEDCDQYYNDNMIFDIVLRFKTIKRVPLQTQLVPHGKRGKLEGGLRRICLNGQINDLEYLQWAGEAILYLKYSVKFKNHRIPNVLQIT